MRVSLTPNRLHAIGVSVSEEEAKKARPRPGTLNMAVLRGSNATESNHLPSPMSAAAPREPMEEPVSKTGRATLGLPATTRRSRISNPPSSYRGPDGAPAALTSSPMKGREETLASSRSSDAVPLSSEQHQTPRAALTTVHLPNVSLTVVPSEGSHALDRSRSLTNGGSPTMDDPDKNPTTSQTGEKLSPRARSQSMSRRTLRPDVPMSKQASLQESSPQVSIGGATSSPPQARLVTPSASSQMPPRLTVSEEPATYAEGQDVDDGRSTPVRKSCESSGRGTHRAQATTTHSLGKNLYLSSGTTEAARQSHEQNADRDSGRVTSPAPCSPCEETGPRSSSSTQSRFTSGQLEDSRTEGPPSRKVPYGRRVSRENAPWGLYRRQSADSTYKPLNSEDDPAVEANATTAEAAASAESQVHQTSTPTTETCVSSGPTLTSALKVLDHQIKCCASVEACQALVAEALAAALRDEKTSKQANGQTSSAHALAPLYGMTQQLVSAVNGTHRSAAASRYTALTASVMASQPVLVMSAAYQEVEDTDSPTYKETQFVAAWLLDDGAPADEAIKSADAAPGSSIPAPAPLLRAHTAPAPKVCCPSPVVSTFSASGLRRKGSCGTMGDAAYLTADEDDDEEEAEDGSDSPAESTADGSSRGDHVKDSQSFSAFFGNREGVRAGYRREGSNSSASAVNRPPPSASRAAIRAVRLSSDGL